MNTNDSLRSLTSGMGDPLHDKAATVFYQDRILNDHELKTAYSNSWIAAKAVDIPAQDCLRKGRDWQAEQEQITLIENEEKRLGLFQKLLECKIKSRLMGGAAIVIGSEGADYAEPFDLERVGKGGIPYLTVMSRTELAAGELERDFGSEWYAKPRDYNVQQMNVNYGIDTLLNVHPSRVVVMIGKAHIDPWTAGGSFHGWGNSVLQSIYSAVVNADSAPANVASLLFEANVDSFGVPDLMEHLSDPEYEQRILNRMSLAKLGKSVSKSLLHDADETYSRHTVNFSNLPETIQSFLLIVSGASDIPLTRFLGQTPSGLSSTGEGDMKNYYDRISSMQTLEIEPAIWRLDEALIRSALGSRPSEIFYSWTPLEQINEKDQAEIGLKNAQAAEVLSRTGLFAPEELRNSVSNQFIENGFYPGLAEAMVAGTPDFDLGGEDDTDTMTDAAPRTLYLRRDVVNAKEIAKWYADQGVTGVYAPESMHTTIIYSKKPIDWMKFGEPWGAQLEIAAGGPRLNEKFGEAGDVLVLQFASHELNWRHERAIELGGSFDFDEYQSHISISLNGADLDLNELKPWVGPIVLGPEIYEEIETGDWREKVVTE